jgi:polyferredoxin
MGIDIRNGLQFDCISCGLCVDACDDVMEKIMLPRGLIAYDTENNQKAREASVASGGLPLKGKMRWIRPRTIFYAAILSLVGSLMLGAILLRSEADLNVIHNRSPLYVRLSDGDIRNNYQIKVLNKSHFDRSYRLDIQGMKPTSVAILAAGDVPVTDVVVPANSVGEFRVEILSDQDSGGRLPISMMLQDKATGRTVKHDSYFIRP